MFFIVSTGRSGTNTLARTLSTIPECLCLHEPSPILIEEAAAYQYGDMPAEKLQTVLKETRSPKVDERVYCESNQVLSLIMPVLRDTFPDSKYIWLMRNGLDVVASAMQKQWYTTHTENFVPYEEATDVEQQWIHGRIRADRCGEMSTADWESLSRFDKCCWYWAYVNRVIERELTSLTTSQHFLIQLEQLPTTLPQLIEWMGLDVAFVPKPEQHNRAKNRIQKWHDWDAKQRQAFVHWCGDLMDRYYPEWRVGEQWQGVTYADDLVDRKQTLITDLAAIILAYGDGGDIQRTMHSLQGQTAVPEQTIIVCTPEFELDADGAGFKNVILREDISDGLVHALNDITARYVILLHAGDEMMPSGVEKQWHILTHHESFDVVLANGYWIDEQDRRIRDFWPYTLGRSEVKQVFSARRMESPLYMLAFLGIVKRELLLNTMNDVQGRGVYRLIGAAVRLMAERNKGLYSEPVSERLQEQYVLGDDHVVDLHNLEGLYDGVRNTLEDDNLQVLFEAWLAAKAVYAFRAVANQIPFNINARREALKLWRTHHTYGGSSDLSKMALVRLFVPSFLWQVVKALQRNERHPL